MAEREQGSPYSDALQAAEEYLDRRNGVFDLHAIGLFARAAALGASSAETQDPPEEPLIELLPSLGSDVVSILHEIRRAQGITQSEIGRRIGLTQAAVAKVESGTHEPRLSTIERYVQALGGTLLLSFAHPANEEQA